MLKILALPLVAGLSYELLKVLAKTKSPLVLPLKVPGMLLQRITTKEPDNDMLEVAIKSFNLVLEMDADQTIPEKQFVMQKPAKEVTQKVIDEFNKVGNIDVSDAEWIVALTTGLSRDEVYSDTIIKAKYIDVINKMVAERKNAAPWAAELLADLLTQIAASQICLHFLPVGKKIKVRLRQAVVGGARPRRNLFFKSGIISK